MAAPFPGPYIEHVTQAGERWDLLAWKYYGDATLFGPIVAANFGVGGVPAMAVFDAGRVVRIPILMVSRVAQNDLPPWKRTS